MKIPAERRLQYYLGPALLIQRFFKQFWQAKEDPQKYLYKSRTPLKAVSSRALNLQIIKPKNPTALDLTVVGVRDPRGYRRPVVTPSRPPAPTQVSSRTALTKGHPNTPVQQVRTRVFFKHGAVAADRDDISGHRTSKLASAGTDATPKLVEIAVGGAVA